MLADECQPILDPAALVTCIDIKQMLFAMTNSEVEVGYLHLSISLCELDAASRWHNRIGRPMQEPKRR